MYLALFLTLSGKKQATMVDVFGSSPLNICLVRALVLGLPGESS